MTVVMLHRVLSQDDPRAGFALPQWTLTTATFEEIVVFAKRHYNLVSLEQVLFAQQHSRPLPQRSLLFTFDDGYEDVFSQALPILKAHGVPAVVFIISDTLDQQGRMWTEDILWMFMKGLLPEACVREIHALVAPPSSLPVSMLVWEIVKRGAQFKIDTIEPVLEAYGLSSVCKTNRRDMLTGEEVAALAANKIDIGAHGKTHVALPMAATPELELQEPKAVLQQLLWQNGEGQISALSFPHGDYTPEIAAQAFANGYKTLFELGDRLNHTVRGFLGYSIMSRINIDGTMITSNGKFLPQRLAASLFIKPRKYAAASQLAGGGPHTGARSHAGGARRGWLPHMKSIASAPLKAR